LIKRD